MKPSTIQEEKWAERADWFSPATVKEFVCRAQIEELRWVLRPRCKEIGSAAWEALVRGRIATLRKALGEQGGA